MSESTAADRARARRVAGECACRGAPPANPMFDCDDCDGSGVRSENKNTYLRALAAFAELREAAAACFCLSRALRCTRSVRAKASIDDSRRFCREVVIRAAAFWTDLRASFRRSARRAA